MAMTPHVTVPVTRCTCSLAVQHSRSLALRGHGTDDATDGEEAVAVWSKGRRRGGGRGGRSMRKELAGGMSRASSVD
eukprot:2309246-Rhodomonas_salina.1